MCEVAHLFLSSLLTPQTTFCAIFKDYVFDKNPLFYIPNLGPKRSFFGPEGAILAQNLKNILGVTS